MNSNSIILYGINIIPYLKTKIHLITKYDGSDFTSLIVTLSFKNGFLYNYVIIKK